MLATWVKTLHRFRFAKQQLYTCISFTSSHNCDVKLPNFTFCGGREHKKTIFFFFLSTLFVNLDTVLLNSTLEKVAKVWQLKRVGIKGEGVWSSANSLFGWRLGCRCRHYCFSSLISFFQRSWHGDYPFKGMANINFLVTSSLHQQERRLWGLMKWSPNRKYFDLWSNSVNWFFKECMEICLENLCVDIRAVGLLRHS